MGERITYYAVTDERDGHAEPAGVLRRVRSDDGQRDEAFGHNDHRWGHTSMLYSHERGDGDHDLQEISAAEANRIVERIRERAAR